MKNRLTFSLIVGILILSMFFLRKGFILLTGEANSNMTFSETEMEKAKYFPMQLRHSKIERKMAPLKYTSDEFQAGMNVLIYGHPDMNEVQKSFAHLRSLGFNSIAINFPFYQTNWRSNEVYINPTNTPTITELQHVIKEAHHIGFDVTLRPIMDEENFLSSSKWRGQIQPEDHEKWFDSYQTLILTYAELAQENDVKMLNIGTELNSLQNKHDDRWTGLIESVRNIYEGELMYSFNWNVVQDIYANKFVKLLDHVGIDAYFPLDIPDGASVKMLEDAWEKQINEFKNKLNHPSIIVTEAGIIPVAGAYRTPYSWTIPHSELNWETQANYYEATFNVWEPIVEGIYWWNITIEEDPEEVSYSPFYSPTEEIIRKQLLGDFFKKGKYTNK